MFMEPSLYDYQMLSKSIQSMSTLEYKTLCYVIAQFLFILLRTRAGNMLGLYKLLVLATLNVVVLILGNIARDVDLLMILTDAPTLLAYQVLADQAVRQYKKLEEDREKASVDSISNDGVPKQDS